MQSIENELNRAEALSSVIVRYIEAEHADQTLLTVMIELSEKIGECHEGLKKLIEIKQVSENE